MMALSRNIVQPSFFKKVSFTVFTLVKFEINQASDKKASSIAIVLEIDVWFFWPAPPNRFGVRMCITQPRWLLGACLLACLTVVQRRKLKPLQAPSLPSTLLTRFLEMVQTVFILIL